MTRRQAGWYLGPCCFRSPFCPSVRPSVPLLGGARSQSSSESAVGNRDVFLWNCRQFPGHRCLCNHSVLSHLVTVMNSGLGGQWAWELTV